MSSQNRQEIQIAKSWPVIDVPLDEISSGDPIRAGGVDSEHVRTLSEYEDALPPILLQKSSMRVIDGMHRLAAARLRGRSKITACILDLTDAEAFLYGVQANVAHGLPLSLADRKSAALRIVELYPDWSDGAVGRAAGVSGKTVSALRCRTRDETAQPARRVGIDGRVRPVENSAGRQVVSQLLESRPEMSLRQIAKAAGVSPGTVRRLRNGTQDQNRTADVLRRPPTLKAVPGEPLGEDEEGVQDATRTAPSKSRRAGRLRPDAVAILQGLRRDPSLKYRANGRELLRLLGSRPTFALGRKVIDTVPAHCVPAVAELFRIYAQELLDLAGTLEQRSMSQSTLSEDSIC